MAVNKRAWWAVKLLVTLGLSALIVWQADWSRVGQVVAEANLLLLGGVFVAMALCVTISTWKWRLLLRIHGVHYAFNRLHRYYFIAMFFNNFLPTSIGGDGYRIYKTLDNPRSRTCAVIAVFMERISGILSLLFIGFLGALAGYFLHDNPLSARVVQAGSAGLLIGVPLLMIVTRPVVYRWLQSRFRIPAMLRNVITHFGEYLRQRGLSAGVLGVSIGFHLFTLAWLTLLIRTLGGELPLMDLAVVSALLSVVAVIPLSINGLGLVDGSFIWLAGQYGLDYDTALAVMLLQRILLIPISLAGGILYFLERRRHAGVPDTDVAS